MDQGPTPRAARNATTRTGGKRRKADDRTSVPRSAAARDATGTTEAIARTVTGLAFRDLPRPVVERAKDLVLDHAGVALLGAIQPWIAKLRSVTLREGGRKESRIYGAGKGPMRNAALTNGAASHALEFDDTHDESLGHPGAVVMPAAIAVGEAQDASGRDLLTAIVAGYEAQCRIGAATGRALIERGFHPTANCGVFGATAAAGSLMRLSTAQLVSAFGSAASMASGVMQFAEDPEGTMIKRMHAGLPAERGVLAAQLAQVGFSGPRGAVDGRYGFARVIAGVEDLGRVTAGLGEYFEIERISVKLYPCCKMFHSLIEAIHAARAATPFALSDVVTIEPFGPVNMIETHMEYRPASTMSAQYSLPWTAAATLALDASSPASFEAAARRKPAVIALAAKVKPRVDAEMDAMYPRRFAAGVRIVLADGREATAKVFDSRSSPGRPPTRDDVTTKFLTLTDGVLPPARQRKIIDTVMALDRGARARDFAALMGPLPGTKA